MKTSQSYTKNPAKNSSELVSKKFNFEETIASKMKSESAHT
jgi:hypothetical protein